MARRFTGATALPTVVAALLLAVAGPATAGPTTARPAGETAGGGTVAVEYDGETIAFAKERGITEPEADQRLGWQVLAPDLDERLRAELSARQFGGVWIAVDDRDRVKVAIAPEVTADAAAIVEREAKALGLTDAYDLVAVRHPVADLEAAGAWLGSEIERANRDARTTLTAGLRTDRNAVELQVPAGATLTPAQRDLLAAARDRLGDQLILGSYTGTPTARACAYPYCDSPLRGGIRITYGPSGTRCTGGFIARSRASGRLLQFTAGHCAYLREGTWHTRLANQVTVRLIGPVAGWLWYTTGDIALLQINDEAGWTPKGWVVVTSGPDTSADQTYRITSDKKSVIGQRICTTGGSYGRSDCGTVQQLGVTATYGGVTVHNLGRASFCGTGGDSGSPMFAKHVGYGLQVAGYSECDSLYQGIRAAENLFGVDVVHASS